MNWPIAHPLARIRNVVLISARPDQGGSLFSGIRLRLAMWYTAAMLAALLLLGTALYFTLRQTLLSPVSTGLHEEAAAVAQQWPGFLFPGCPPLRDSALWACFDAQGHLANTSRNVELASGFAETGVAQEAIQQGSGEDLVDTHGPWGTVDRYALRAQDATGRVLGVVIVGAAVGGELHALHVLLTLLFVLGAFVVVAAAIGGLFLADRALHPARLAYARQRDFIADASHELRTPLTLLRADADVLLRGRSRLPEDDALILEDMVQETAHMSALADSMLDLAQLEAGRTRGERDVVNLAELASGIARRASARALEEGVSIQVTATEPVLVIGDPVMLEQAVMALVDNALKYNHAGGEVLIRVEKQDRWAFLEVRDTGVGIAEQHLAFLGERFYRVDKARSRATGGAGLGLSIVRGIVEQHGGSLRFNSAPDQGTAVTLQLPAA